jgi:hypothetical protein
MYIHTEYPIYFKISSAYVVFAAYIRRGSDSNFLQILDFVCQFGVFFPYFIRILAYFSTYVCILSKIQTLYGCLRILRRIIRNTLTYITYATATAYNWWNIRVWSLPALSFLTCTFPHFRLLDSHGVCSLWTQPS